MDSILSLQSLASDDAAEGGSWFSLGCNNNSKTSNCCTGTCPAPEIEEV